MSWSSSLLFGDSLGITGGSFVKPQPFIDHPLNKSAFFRGGGGVKNWSNLSMDVSKKLPTGHCELKYLVKDASNLASFYGSHIDGIICV